VSIDDHGLHAAARELVGEHQAGRTRSDDQNLGIHIVPPLTWSVEHRVAGSDKHRLNPHAQCHKAGSLHHYEDDVGYFK
jgi:hypothetical protein